MPDDISKMPPETQDETFERALDDPPWIAAPNSRSISQINRSLRLAVNSGRSGLRITHLKEHRKIALKVMKFARPTITVESGSPFNLERVGYRSTSTDAQSIMPLMDAFSPDERSALFKEVTALGIEWRMADYSAFITRPEVWTTEEVAGMRAWIAAAAVDANPAVRYYAARSLAIDIGAPDGPRFAMSCSLAETDDQFRNDFYEGIVNFNPKALIHEKIRDLADFTFEHFSNMYVNSSYLYNLSINSALEDYRNTEEGQNKIINRSLVILENTGLSPDVHINAANAVAYMSGYRSLPDFKRRIDDIRAAKKDPGEALDSAFAAFAASKKVRKEPFRSEKKEEILANYTEINNQIDQAIGFSIETEIEAPEIIDGAKRAAEYERSSRRSIMESKLDERFRERGGRSI